MASKGLYTLGRAAASKAIKSDYAKRKIKGYANKYLDQALDSFTSDVSKKLDPIHRGGGIPIPFPFVDLKKGYQVLTAPGLFKGPSVSAKEGKALVAEYKTRHYGLT